MIRHESTDCKAIKKEKILIICSCLNENIYLQQNVVMVSQFIDELIADYDITILTSRDTVYLIAPNCVKIVASKINVRTILKVLKEEKIRKIIPIDCSLKMISDVRKKYKIENFFHSFFNANKSVSSFRKKAKDVGFIVKRKISQKKTMRSLCFLLIKDNFGNQIVLDSLEIFYVNDKKVFVSDINLEVSQQRRIKQLVDNFGELLCITGYPYTLKLSISEDGDVYYNEVVYGFTDELIFSLQRQRINLAKMLLDIKKRKSVFYSKKQSTLMVSVDYSTYFYVDFNANFFKSWFYAKDIANKVVYNKIEGFIAPNTLNDIHVFDCTTDLMQLKSIDFHTYSDFILISMGQEFIDDINNQLFFCKICNLLAETTGRKLLLLTKTMLPIFQILKNCHIVIGDYVEEKNFRKILDKYKIKSAYVLYTTDNLPLLNLLVRFNIKVYCADKSKDTPFRDQEESLIDFCNLIGVPCKYERFHSDEIIVYFSCILDNHKNIALSTISSEKFYGMTNSKCYFYPSIRMDYDFEDKAKEIISVIIDNIKYYGLLTIAFIYKDGEMYVNHIYVNTVLFSVFFHKDDMDTFYKICLASICEKNISPMLQKSKFGDLPKFYQKICFKHIDKQFIELDGVTKNKVFKKYSSLFGDK